jgi:acyl-CoA reductase-like NAD-dependent aldehyde dehydrogenase
MSDWSTSEPLVTVNAEEVTSLAAARKAQREAEYQRQELEDRAEFRRRLKELLDSGPICMWSLMIARLVR